MSDLPNSEWLNSELGRQLSPVAAPDNLWDRIHEQRRPLRTPPTPWRNWSLATAALLILLGSLAWRLAAMRAQDSGLETLAARELASFNSTDPASLDIRSADPIRLNSWMETNLGVSLPLAHLPPTSIQLIGARLVHFRGAPVGMLEYRAGNARAALLVTASRTNTGRSPAHASAPFKADGGRTLYSWSEGRNDYALAFTPSGSTQQPCLLCHAMSPALMILN